MPGREGVVPAAVRAETAYRILEAVDDSGHDGGGKRITHQHPAPSASAFIAAGLHSYKYGSGGILKIIIISIMEIRDDTVA